MKNKSKEFKMDGRPKIKVKEYKVHFYTL